MATSSAFIEYVMDELKRLSVGVIRSKKMFGEYMVYIDEKPILLICDNVVYVKDIASISQMMVSAERGQPYKGAKEHYILDIEDSEVAGNVIAELIKLTPIPAKKKR